MKDRQGKVLIHIVRHEPTGAEVPVIIHKTENGMIKEFEEVPTNRKCFSFPMICKRWNVEIEVLKATMEKYEIPAFLRREDYARVAKKEFKDGSMLEYAMIFEEYIYALEKKFKIPHSKLKAKPFHILQN